MELLQVYVRYTLNIFLFTRQYCTILIKSDIKTQFRLIIKKCALLTCNTSNKLSFKKIISVSLKLSVGKYVDRF